MATLTRSRNLGEPSAESRHSEGTLAAMIEDQTARLPSDVFLWSALGSVGLSLFCMVTNRQNAANFIGQWAPTLLILGIYNKLVKLQGHDRES